jgi:hypothetical protein
MSKRTYNWKRYWCRREGQFSLADGGFLVDPNSEAARYYKSDVVAFESIASKPCLVLLGEPGIGKSTALDREYASVGRTLSGTGGDILRADLGEYSTDGQLSRKVFGSTEIERWTRGNYNLHLFLDSLDEARLRIDNISAVLRSELRDLPTDRLRLRIVCRSADWPGDLEAFLRDTWGEDDFGVFELVPLTKSDVVVAAETWGIPPDKFLQAVAELGVAPLANRPITLEFLLGAFSRGQSLPTNRTALYAEGCKLLCGEPSDCRRAAPKGHGKLTASQRLEIAGRIGAMMQFSNRGTIWTGAGQSDMPDEDVPLECFVGGCEGEWPATTVVDLPAMEEVLGNGLFSALGLRRLGWSHQTYAEFLAAYHLKRHKVPSASMLRLIQHPDGSGKVVPQLRETAAWLASMDSGVFAALAAKDPETLLRSDLAGASDSERTALAARLLELFESREIVDDLELYLLFDRLTNPHLAGTIRPYLVDRSKQARARHAAISIALACRLTILQSELVAIALDTTDDHQIRIGAAAAVCEIGAAASRAALLPLLGSPGGDPDDELKGLGLLAGWPAHLTTVDLFAALTPRKDPQLFGTYHRFLTSNIVRHLKPDDLPAALKWAARNIRGYPDVEPLTKLALDILTLAADHGNRAGIPELVAAVMINNWELLSFHNNIAEKLRASEALRYGIAAAALPMLLAHPYGPSIFKEACALTSHDLRWLLGVFEQSGFAEERALLSHVVPWLLDPCDVDAFDAALTAAGTCAVLAVELQPWIRPVPLDSTEAREARELYRRLHEREEGGHEQSQRSPPDTGELESILDKATPGVFYEIWFRLNGGALSAFPRSREPITGWSALGTSLKTRVVDAAKDYLANYYPLGTTKWWKEGRYAFPEIAGYDALSLLHTVALSLLGDFQPDVWRRWARIVVALVAEDKETRARLLRLVYEHAPDTVIETIDEVVDGENERHGTVLAFQHLEGLWDDRIADLARGKLTGGTMRVQSFRNLLSLLLEKGDAQAQKYAESLVVGPIPAEGEQREIVVGACAELLNHTPESAWHVAWPIMKADRQFGLKVVGAAGVTFTTKLKEEDVADLYLWLLPQQTGQRGPPDNSWADARGIGTLASMLGNRGTPEACRALRRVVSERPHLEGLRWYLKQAEELARRKTWIPPSPKEVMKLVSDPSARLVRSADELVELLLESLSRLQTRLQGKPPAVVGLWDEVVRKNKRAKRVFRPKDEPTLSDYVKLHLDDDLVERGVIANREVKLSTYLGGAKGEQTDVHVDVTVPGVGPGVFEKLTVIIELKGCWNPDLKHAMETQLVDRYLTGGNCRHGIYVVGWFACNQGDNADGRRSATPKISLDDAARQFESQAGALSHSGVSVRSVVLNAALP